ncbi:Suppressor of ferric uptake 1 [Umbelopsis nana]
MTPRWEHYNKPSTTTSVDSCHKMPLEEPQQRLFESKSSLSSPTAGVECLNDRSQLHAGVFDKTNVTSSSSMTTGHAEPCNSSVARSDIGSGSAVACSNCGVTATPLWRRAPTGEIICNACGLYLKARNATRPTWLKRNTFARKNVNASKLQHRFVLQDQTTCSTTKSMNDSSEEDQQTTSPCSPPVSENNDSHPQEPSTHDRPQMTCANCSTTTTPLWRRDEEGNTICNACGLYYKLHNVQRPVTMKRSVIKRRKRVHANIISQHHHPLPQPIQQRRLCPKHHQSSSSSSSDEQPPMLIHDSSSGGEASSSGTDDDESNDRKRRYYDDGFRTVKRMNLGYPSHYMQEKAPAETMQPPTHGPSHISSLLNPVVQDSTMERKSQSTATAAAIATVSALLNPHSDVQHTQKVLEAHRQELRREVQHLTSLLSKTNAVLDNLDHAMVHAGVEPSSPSTNSSSARTPGFSPTAAVSILGNLLGGGDPNATNALATILTLGAAAAAAQKESHNIHLAPLKASPTPPCHRELPPTPPPCPILPYPMDRRQSASSDSR